MGLFNFSRLGLLLIFLITKISISNAENLAYVGDRETSKAKPCSIVTVEALSQSGQQSARFQTQGIGWVLKNGSQIQILTPMHVVSSAQKIRIVCNEFVSHAKVIRQHALMDLSLLSISDIESEVPQAQFRPLFKFSEIEALRTKFIESKFFKGSSGLKRFVTTTALRGSEGEEVHVDTLAQYLDGDSSSHALFPMKNYIFINQGMRPGMSGSPFFDFTMESRYFSGVIDGVITGYSYSYMLAKGIPLGMVVKTKFNGVESAALSLPTILDFLKGTYVRLPVNFLNYSLDLQSSAHGIARVRSVVFQIGTQSLKFTENCAAPSFVSVSDWQAVGGSDWGDGGGSDWGDGGGQKKAQENPFESANDFLGFTANHHPNHGQYFGQPFYLRSSACKNPHLKVEGLSHLKTLHWLQLKNRAEFVPLESLSDLFWAAMQFRDPQDFYRLLLQQNASTQNFKAQQEGFCKALPSKEMLQTKGSTQFEIQNNRNGAIFLSQTLLVAKRSLLAIQKWDSLRKDFGMTCTKDQIWHRFYLSAAQLGNASSDGWVEIRQGAGGAELRYKFPFCEGVIVGPHNLQPQNLNFKNDDFSAQLRFEWQPFRSILGLSSINSKCLNTNSQRTVNFIELKLDSAHALKAGSDSSLSSERIE